MLYKTLHSVEYTQPNWDEIMDDFIVEWTEKIENENWYYPGNTKEYDKRVRGHVAPINKLESKEDKSNYLIEWEINNQECKTIKSPLHDLCLSSYKPDQYLTMDIYGLVNEIHDEYYNSCKLSFIDANMPTLYGVDEDDEEENEYDDHVKYLRKVFYNSNEMEIESTCRVEQMLKTHFLLKDLYLLVKYQTPDENELTLSLTEKFDKLVSNSDWKVFSEEIKVEAKKNYRAAFIFLNMNPEIKGTMFEDASIVKLGKLFDEFYDYLAEQFCTDILNVYKCRDKTDEGIK